MQSGPSEPDPAPVVSARLPSKPAEGAHVDGAGSADESIDGRQPPEPAATTAAPPTAEATPATREQQVFAEYARRAQHQWASSVPILEHGEPPVFAEVADELAHRLADVDRSTPAPERQALVNEQRQLLEAIRHRYEGIPPLMRLMDDLDAELADLQAQLVTVGPSPDPKASSAQP